jgi:hypothetical protein
MTMARSFADYQVLFDGGFTLDSTTPDREKRLSFDLPSNWQIRDDSRKPILAFHAAVTRAAQFKVLINSREVKAWNLAVGFTRGLWDPFNGSLAWPDESRGPDPAPVDFVLTEGKVQIGQVVLWYQVEE